MTPDWRMLLSDEAQNFVRAHEDDDLAQLALAPFPFAPSLRALVLDQVKARRKARDKMPSWHAMPGIIFPRSPLLEQASSEALARYKARLAHGERFVDLTAGAGIDAAAWSAGFQAGICVEPDREAADLLRHNLPLLTTVALEVMQSRAEDVLERITHADLIYLDPQRRDDAGRRSFRLEDGRPDPRALLPLLASKSARIVLKTSPMLDIASALAALAHVVGIQVLEWRGECREVLYVIAPGAAPAAPPRVSCVAIDDAGTDRARFEFAWDEERQAQAVLSLPRRFIIEPGPALLKAGAFELVASRFGLGKLHPSTHLYTCDDASSIPASLPARIYELQAVLKVDAREVAAALSERRARLTLRNFPGSLLDLQRRLGLRGGGGEEVLFACTLEDGRKVILHARPRDNLEH